MRNRVNRRDSNDIKNITGKKDRKYWEDRNDKRNTNLKKTRKNRNRIGVIRKERIKRI